MWRIFNLGEKEGWRGNLEKKRRYSWKTRKGGAEVLRFGGLLSILTEAVNSRLSDYLERAYCRREEFSFSCVNLSVAIGHRLRGIQRWHWHSSEKSGPLGIFIFLYSFQTTKTLKEQSKNLVKTNMQSVVKYLWWIETQWRLQSFPLELGHRLV